jgi:hypothetical protein
MALIAVMRGKPKDGYPHWRSNKDYAKLWSYISTILPQNRTHLKQTTAVAGVMVNLKMVATIVTSSTADKQ